MAETDELPRLPYVSSFPTGCGPHALVIDRKPKEDPPPPAAESKEFAAEKSLMRCSNSPVVDSPALDLGNNSAADGQTCQGMIGGSSKSNQDDKLGLLDDGLEQGPKASGALETAGSRKRPYTSNLCSCSRKRPAVAIRDFPVGCGINTPRMTREEALKLVAEEMSPTEDMPPPTEDPHPTATSKDSASPKVATSNEETVQEREAEVKVSDFLPPPNSEILEAEKPAIDGEGDHFPGK